MRRWWPVGGKRAQTACDAVGAVETEETDESECPLKWKSVRMKSCLL